MFFSRRRREHAGKSSNKAITHKPSAYFRLDAAQLSISMPIGPESQVGRFPLLGDQHEKPDPSIPARTADFTRKNSALFPLLPQVGAYSRFIAGSKG